MTPQASDVIAAVVGVVNAQNPDGAGYRKAASCGHFPVTPSLLSYTLSRSTPVYHVRCICEHVVREHVRSWMGVDDIVPSGANIILGLWGGGHISRYGKRMEWTYDALRSDHVIRSVYNESLKRLSDQGFSLHRYRRAA
jgi:hypothetical protein